MTGSGARRKRSTPVRLSLAAGALVTILAPPAGAVTGGHSVPDGFTVLSTTEASPGVVHSRLARQDPPLVVNVARVAPEAPVSLRAVLSNETVAGEGARLERTSSMCARVGCILGVNGDFADVDSSVPLGGLVTDGRMLRSPSDKHHQLSIGKDGELSTGGIDWSGKLVPTDLQPIAIDGVNAAGGDDLIVLYTAAYGPAVDGAGGVGVLVRTVEPAGPLRLGQTTMVDLVAMGEDQPAIPIGEPGAGVLVGYGEHAQKLRDLWARVQAGGAGSRALLRLETASAVTESVGGSPILVRDGRRWFADVDDNFTQGRHPRTVVGWTSAGEVLLVTVDGRQPEHSVGMTLAEATEFMLELGVVEAINLDGGGSTTFVTRGTVANQPSDVAVKEGGQQVIRHAAQRGERVVGHVERPVASALMVVPANTVQAAAVDPLAGPSIDLPQALAVGSLAPAADPGSVPDGGLPALVTEEGPDLTNTFRVAAVAANVAAAVGLGAVFSRHRRAGSRTSSRAGLRLMSHLPA
ncbi:MAG: phosphodiester glycosidase family protein [Acidimicrobiia bacterium]